MFSMYSFYNNLKEGYEINIINGNESAKEKEEADKRKRGQKVN
jgi:hypothetical protein